VAILKSAGKLSTAGKYLTTARFSDSNSGEMRVEELSKLRNFVWMWGREVCAGKGIEGNKIDFAGNIS